MFLRLLTLLAIPTLCAWASQPANVHELPDPNPEVERQAFLVPEGFEINLYASDPMIQKPVQMNWDSAGRLWVVSSTTYPHIKPGEEAKDQVVVLEDTDHDGKADKSSVFSEGLHIPTAVIPGDGGAYIANSTEVVFDKDSDGDLKSDSRTVLLSGFGTEDTHHLLHTMRFGPEGLLYFLQSIYIHSHVETPYGVRRLLGGGVWEFRPETKRLEVISKGLINPWGFEFDRWGQSFAADGAGSEGVNFIFPGSVFKTSPGANRTLSGLSPGQPKHSGQEIVEEPQFPADWQGNVIQCDFRGNRINRFSLTPSGSSYTAKQEPDVLASNHRAFRPIDVKFGPDGALYIADWYNPIIQHGEVDFRDERRDHVHGRIWRLSAKGRPLSERPNFKDKSAADLVAMLTSDRKYVRHFAKREIRALGADAAVPAIDAAAASLQPSTEANTHQLLELAWARECVNSFSAKLWRTLWSAKTPQARAAALRILTHRWKEVPEHMAILEAAVADENAQVRLWALCLADQVRSSRAVELALHVLEKPMDESLDFLLEQMCREQADFWLPAYNSGKVKILSPKQMIYALRASGRPESFGPLVKAFKGHQLSTADNAAVLEAASVTADSAGARELATLASAPEFKDSAPAILDALIKAASDRKIVPESAQASVTQWLEDARAEVVHRATLLAGLWKVEAAREKLQTLLTEPNTQQALRDGAVSGLAKLGGEKSKAVFDQLFSTQPLLALRGLTAVAPGLAAKRAVEHLAKLTSGDEAKPIFADFLANKQLPAALAKALEGASIPEAIAVEGIRAAATRGVTGPLEAALKKAGGVKAADQQLTPEGMAALVAKVKSSGSAARGEQVYRRQALLCQTCHAIGDAGGLLGPNLVSIGASAPVDYLIESLLNPSAKIKEGYHMVMVTKKDGQMVAGGLVTDGAEELVIRDPANQLQKVAKSQVASKQISSASMMPAGLTASLRQDEFVDLVRFLSELGREGAYKIAPKRFVRSWRGMGVMEQATVDHIRHVGLPALNDPNTTYPWQRVYSTVDGSLPLSELPAANKMYPWFPKIAQFGLKLAEAHTIKLGLNEIRGVALVVDDHLVSEVSQTVELKLTAGSHLISVLVTRENAELQNKALSVEILSESASVY